ncbi:MAG: radical SAM protein, partial [Candidatus Izimaplasma sp.]|nr:radical SAM protein [Candidatus Izimaplasma bacterium]
SKEYKGKLWLEMMFIKGYNNDLSSILKYQELLAKINYDKLYLNTPIRPPAESYVLALTSNEMRKIESKLGGISIDLLDSEGFYSDISDHFQAILSIIKRHPMNQHEIKGFLKTRKCKNIDEIIVQLKQDLKIDIINYKGYYTFRLK